MHYTREMAYIPADVIPLKFGMLIRRRKDSSVVLMVLHQKPTNMVAPYLRGPGDVRAWDLEGTFSGYIILGDDLGNWEVIA